MMGRFIGAAIGFAIGNFAWQAAFGGHDWSKALEISCAQAFAILCVGWQERRRNKRDSA
jgi:hypothetical protein